MPTQILPAASLRNANRLPAGRTLSWALNYLICLALWSIGRAIFRAAADILPDGRELSAGDGEVVDPEGRGVGAGFSFDDLVGAGEDRGRDLDADLAGGRLVDHQLDGTRLPGHGFARLGAFQHLVGVGGEHRVHFRPLDAIARKAAGLDHLAKLADRRQFVFEAKPG